MAQKKMAADTEDAAPAENEAFLSRQLITYLGNKRSLLDFIGQGLRFARERLGKNKIDIFDVFSGSGAAARYFKRFAALLAVNDLEPYAAIINRCYLANAVELDMAELQRQHDFLRASLTEDKLAAGIISELYAPADENCIREGERVFYTPRNARYIDTARRLIETLPETQRPFFLAPLLSQASVHANTSGVFKGFYKNPHTGIGQFGGKNRDALERITGRIELPFPVFSAFSCQTRIFCGDANRIVLEAPEVDLAYVDPPYNQHPYGSNYFMLNVIASYRRPQTASAVSGIPADWNRSDYNKPQAAYGALRNLLENLRAKFVLLSFNSDGFISAAELKAMLAKIGRVEVLERPYNTFRGSRNLRARSIHVKEYLFILEK